MNFSFALHFEISELPKPSNQAKATELLTEFCDISSQLEDERTKKILLHLAKDEAGKAFLESIFGNSPYLSKIIMRYPGTIADIFEWGFSHCWRNIYDAIEAECMQAASVDELKRNLRIAKQKVALLTAAADIIGRWELEHVTETLSQFAEMALTHSVNYLLRQFHEKGDIELKDLSNPSHECGLIILGMGKLGALELNYSSDIDLIIFFEDTLHYTGSKNLQHCFIKLVRELVAIMEQRTMDGYVFRMDLRLRPDPSSTPVAISSETALAYYESVGQNWERAAMIKARPVAGDIEAAKDFLKELKPYVWRKYMDFAGIQDIHSIKRQISSGKKPISKDLREYNIKLGHGGIREIEFFAQTQQLIWGGRESELRSRATCEALLALAQTGRVRSTTIEELIDIYRYLRELEHRLQMVDDMQTHSLPATKDGMRSIAIFMGYENLEQFTDDLYSKLTTVKEHYAALFAAAPELGHEGSLAFTGTDGDPETINTLQKLHYRQPHNIWLLIKNWHHGKYRSTHSVRSREMLTEMMPSILKFFGNTPDPDASIIKFDEFLSKLPSSLQFFSLCSANPQLLELMADIMGSFPYLAENLSRKPSLLEYVLYNDFLDPLVDKQELIQGLNLRLQEARDYQDILDITRRWTHDRQFRVGVQLIKQKITASQARHYLSDIAETVLPLLLYYTQEEFFKRRGKVVGGDFIVVALGKLGGHELMFDSDIDLIFVYDAPDNVAMSDGANPLSISEYYIKLSRRFISSFTALTQEGRLYEIDIRLRPSGKDGPISSNLPAFKKYYETAAWIFEFMALTRARVISGGAVLSEKVSELIHEQLCKPRNPVEVAVAMHQLRKKTEQVHPSNDPWNIKYVRGGLMDVEFIAQYLQLIHAHEHPEILDLSTQQCFKKLGEAGLIPLEDAQTLEKNTAFLLDIQTLRRIAFSREMPMDQIPIGLKSFFVKSMHKKSFKSLASEIITVQQEVLAYFNNYIVKGCEDHDTSE